MSAKSHSARLKKMARNVSKEVARQLYLGGQELELAMERGIVSGSVSGKNHVPGPPGGYPNADTRDLDSKIDTKLVSSGPTVQVSVTAYSQHAVFQQWGTSKMAARPFATLALRETEGKIRARVKNVAVTLAKR